MEIWFILNQSHPQYTILKLNIHPEKYFTYMGYIENIHLKKIYAPKYWRLDQLWLGKWNEVNCELKNSAHYYVAST